MRIWVVGLALGAALCGGAPPASAQISTRQITIYSGAANGVGVGIDVILTETRKGKAATYQVDVCYPVRPGSRRMDRAVFPVTLQSSVWTGSGAALASKEPVKVALKRSAPADTFTIEGTVTVNALTLTVLAEDSAFADAEPGFEPSTLAPSLAEAPDADPGSLQLRVAPEKAAAALKRLQGIPLVITEASLAATCEELRNGRQEIALTVDPARAAEVIEKVRGDGVIAVGFLSGAATLTDAVRFPAGTDLQKIMRNAADSLAKMLGAAPLQTLPAADPATGKVTFVFRQPVATLADLGATEQTRVVLLVTTVDDRPMLYVSSAETNLVLPDGGLRVDAITSSGEDDGVASLITATLIRSVAKALKGELWDGEALGWEPAK